MADCKTKGIPVLMYHALEDESHPSGAKDAGEQRYVLPVSQFREQMEYLQREGYRTFLLEELQTLAEWPDKAVVLTFDDGHESNFTLAFPTLLEYGFKAEFFITTGWIGTPYFMNEEQIRGLHRSGMGIGSHGVTHRFLTDIGSEDLENEFRQSMKVLSDIVEDRIITFSYPGGRMNGMTTSRAIKEGYQCVCSSEPYKYNVNTSQETIPRISISNQVSKNVFLSLLFDGESAYLSVRYKFLTMMKTILGNKRYEGMRSILLGSKSNSHLTTGAR